MKIAKTCKFVCFATLILNFIILDVIAQPQKENALPKMVLKQTLTGLNGWAETTKFSPDSKTILGGGINNDKSGGTGAAKLWDLATGRITRILKWSSCGFHQATFSPDGKFLAIGSGETGGPVDNCDKYTILNGQTIFQEGQITILNAQTGSLVRILTAPNSTGVDSVAFSPDSKTIVGGTQEGTLELWDVQTGRKKMTLEKHRCNVFSVEFSPDGKTIASSSCVDIKIWNAKSGALKQTLTGEAGDFSDSIAFSIDGKSLISGSGRQSNVHAKVWDVQTGKLINTIQGAKPPLAFSPDGRILASGGLKKGTILLWDWGIDNASVRQELIGHTDSILALDFSSDGKMLASGSQDRSIKIWESRGNTTSTVTITGYIDVIEKVGDGCRIRIIAGEKIYTGIVTFSQLSVLTKQKINNYEDAVRVSSGLQTNVTLSDTESSTNDISAIKFGKITTMTFPVSRGTRQTIPTWNERTTNKETIIDLSTDILFDFDKATIKSEAVPTLIKLARLIRQSSNNIIQLNGFTDSKGTDEYNLNLSERRAEAVKQWLVTKGGIDANWLQTKGYGESNPVAPNTNQDGSDNPNGRQKNRRVEVRIPRN